MARAIRSRKDDLKPVSVFRLEKGWLGIERDEVAVFTPLKDTKVEIRRDPKVTGSVEEPETLELGLGQALLLYPDVVFRTKSRDAPFVILRLPTEPLAVKQAVQQG
jgi:hypothetical protein